ncbi:MAG: ABC transporter ATP-binding protein [Firmicutes bacterium]|nr:ABC transporter ATP-binding protein [Bacillota bacterium]
MASASNKRSANVSIGGPGGRQGGGGRAGKMMPGEKADNFWPTMKTLLGYLAKYKFRLSIIVIFAIASTIFNVISPTILGDATDVVVKGIMGDGVDYGALFNILMLLLALYVASLLFGVIQGWLMADVSQSVIYTLRDKMSVKLDRMPLKYYDSTTHGELQSRMINDIETVNQSLSVSLTQMITSFITLIGILAMMIRISLIMTCIVVLVIPLSMVVIRIVVSKSQGHFKNQQKYLGSVNGHVEEMYTGHDIIQAFNREEESEKTFEDYNDKLYNSAWKSQFLSGLMMPLTSFIGNLSYVCVCLFGGYLAIKGSISIGNIQAFIQYVRSFNQPIQQVANVVNQLQSTAAAAERIFELIDEEEEDGLDETAECEVALELVKGNVRFDHVTFGYKEDEPVINDFSFTAYPGQTIAIVGPTGAGKTTLVKLLMRFYELNGGKIMVDGYDITKISGENLRSLFGMVLQETWLNSSSIRENIRYGKPDATDEEVEAAAKAAHIDHFIRTQPQGYDTPINEEATNISQGQKQLLTIARAILSDAPIMILDEATSSVDTRTEVQIQQAMDNLTSGRTSFIIAHRLSTIRNANHILVMNHGDIVEQGTHEQLLEKGGFYADLYNSQFAEN